MGKAKRYGIFIIIMIIASALSAAALYHYNHISIKKQCFRFNYGSKLPNTSDAYFTYSSKYDDVSFDEKLFDLSAVGSYEVIVNFADKDYTLYIEIVDEKAPTITFLNDHALIYRYEDTLIGNFYQVEDISAVKSEILLESQKNSKQEVCVSAVDAYDNKTEKCKSLTVEIQDLKLVDIPEVNSVKELVEAFIQENGLNADSFAFFYESPSNQESYLYNEKRVITAASIIKVPLNMIYEDAYINQTMRPSQTIRLTLNDIEEGDGYTSQNKLNSALSYAYLQEQSIVYSDNTATNMLVRGLGGFSAFRRLLTEYTDLSLPQTFYSQNIITAEYMKDVMKKLYDEQDRYHTLISYMKQAAKDNFLQASSDIFEIAQKYGLYDNVLHTVGIVYTPQPYIVGIFTMNREDGEAIIAKLNEWLIAYQFQKYGL